MDPIDLTVKVVLTPFLNLVQGFAAPVLAFIPDGLEEEAKKKLLEFATEGLRAGLALLLQQGLLTIETSGQITLKAHKGPHPDDL